MDKRKVRQDSNTDKISAPRVTAYCINDHFDLEEIHKNVENTVFK